MKIQNFSKVEMPMSAAEAQDSLDLNALFDGHVAREFADQDVDATMATMIPVAHERFYWDQASLLVQVGLLETGKLPVVGSEQARSLLRVTE